MFRHAFVLAIFLVATGCAQPYVIRAHSGAERPVAELVRVKGQDHTLFLASIDGREKDYSPFFRGPLVYSGFELLLDPGEHTIGVYYALNMGAMTDYTKPRYLKFNGLAGSVYEVFSARERNSVRIGLRQIE